MPHIGTPPVAGFKSTTKQSFSGDNSTVAFTLNRASSSETDLEVFVDNIQQEPTTAYSVSGTTLTFTEAPPTGTNNVYVVNRGGDQNGLLPPQDLGTTDYIFGDDISFNSDSAKLNFGADSEITVTHVADTGLNLKHTATGDDKPIVLTLQTGETDIAADDVLGAINFQAPDESTGTDAILVAAGIEAVSEGDFSSSSNATKLSFKTASSAAASETMSLSSAGLLTISDDLVIGDGKTIGSATTPAAITIASNGLVTISRSDNAENLSLVSTDADASVGPTLRMDRQSASAADGDLLGKINFVGHNDAGTPEDIAYAGITAIINDASDGTEDGKLAINTIVAGTERSRVFIDAGETVLNEDSVDVDFRVESNGDANMFVVDAGNNRVGIGTGTPDFPLDIEGSVADDAVTTVVRISADDPAASDDHAELQIKCGNGASSTVTRRVELHALSNGGSDNRNLVLNPSGGNVLIGTTAVPDASNGGAAFEPAADNRSILNLGCTTTSSRNVATFRNSNNLVGSINVSGTTTGFNTSSDYRLKENVVTDWDATTRLKQLKPSQFNFKVDKDTTVDGFLAHEVSSIVPIAIAGEKDEVETYTDDNGKEQTRPVYQGIDQSKLVPLLVKTVQEALARIETLETKVKTLEGG